MLEVAAVVLMLLGWFVLWLSFWIAMADGAWEPGALDGWPDLGPAKFIAWAGLGMLVLSVALMVISAISHGRVSRVTSVQQGLSLAEECACVGPGGHSCLTQRQRCSSRRLVCLVGPPGRAPSLASETSTCAWPELVGSPAPGGRAGSSVRAWCFFKRSCRRPSLWA